MIDPITFRARIGTFKIVSDNRHNRPSNFQNYDTDTLPGKSWIILMMCGFLSICVLEFYNSGRVENSLWRDNYEYSYVKSTSMWDGDDVFLLGKERNCLVENLFDGNKAEKTYVLSGVKFFNGSKGVETCVNICTSICYCLSLGVGKYMRMVNGNTSKKFIHWNGGSAFLENKMEYVEELIYEHEPVVLAISEANLRESTEVSCVRIENYNLLTLKAISNVNMKISRIVAYVRNDVVYKRRTDLENDHDAMIWLEIKYKGGRNLILGLVYREHKYLMQTVNNSGTDEEQLTRWRTIVDKWEIAGDTNDVVVMGDTNIDWTDWNNLSGIHARLAEVVNNQIITSGFSQMINKSTHRGIYRDTIIDHIWLNCPLREIECVVEENLNSDHNVIVAKIRGRDMKLNDENRKGRIWKGYTKQKLLEGIRSEDWNGMYNTENIHIAVEIFTENLTKILNNIAPMGNFNNKVKYKNYIQRDTRNLRAQKHRLWKDYESNRTEENWGKYRRIRNKYTKSLREDKISYEKRFMEDIKERDTGKELWRVIYSKAGWIKNLSPMLLNENGSVIRKKAEIANIINTFYKAKIENLIRNIPVVNQSPTKILRKVMNDWIGSEIYPTKMKLKTVNKEMVGKIVGKLSNSTSVGIDGIPMRILKDGIEEINVHIMRIINLSISTKIFPNKWKIGKIIPLFKGQGYDKESKTAYRPVCLLPAVSKIVEKVITEQLVEHMESKGLFHPCQFAYRKGLSTVEAMTTLHEEWMNAIDMKKQSILISIDMSAAFDMVNHEILLDKLKIYGLDDSVLEWTKSYLTYRSQYVSIGDINSGMEWIKHGVPQGSILGPILYLIYTNEMPGISNLWCRHLDSKLDRSILFGRYCTTCGVTSCYADDSNFTIASKDNNLMLFIVTRVIETWQNFCNSNYLCMNDNKTAMMRLAPRQQHQVNPPETVILDILDSNGERIKPKIEHKLLGTNIKRDLTWGNQLCFKEKAMIPDLRKKIGTLKMVSKYLDMASIYYVSY